MKTLFDAPATPQGEPVPMVRGVRALIPNSLPVIDSVMAGGKTFAPPHSGPDTSKAAAKHVARNATRNEELLLAWIKSRGSEGACDHEIAAHFGWTDNYVRPRRWRWSREGVLVRSDVKRATPSGCMARAWIYVEGQG